jgi:streptogramin lyase
MTSSTRFLLCATFALAAFTAAGPAQSITEFPVSEFGTPFRITPGPDGALWFTTFGEAVARITTAGAVTYFNFPGVWMAVDITTGPDGNLWFTSGKADDAFPNAAVRRVTSAGVLTIFPLPDDRSLPWGITHGQDGALWLTERSGNKIGRLTTTGVLTEFPLPTAASSPTDIVGGPDGALWFTQTGGNRIGRITTDGVITEFPISSPATGIARGPDSNMWFTQRSANRIGRITPEGDVTELPLPTAGSGPVDIVGGNDGALWFTERDANRIGRITVTGVVTEYPIPTPASSPEGITLGPDGNIWFTEALGDKIGRVTTRVAFDPGQILPVVGSTMGVGGSFFRTSVQLHNAGATSLGGRIVFHPSGTPGSEGDPGLDFTLAPGQTQTIPDLLPAMGSSGLGSADIITTVGSGSNVPIVSARVFNDAGAAGTTGFALNALTPDAALPPGRPGVLTIPSDLTNFRINVGVRTLAANVAMTLTVRDAAGAVAAVVPKFFPATYHEQQAATVFLNGLPLPPGGSITALVESGTAIVYGATVDNRTGDPSLQIASPAP